MSNAKVVMSQAANTLTTPLDVEDVFSTYLYDGNGTSQTITNGIDLAGEGGLVWWKRRDAISNHLLTDSDRGITKHLTSQTSDAEVTNSTFYSSFNSDGFTLGSGLNPSGVSGATWTFRKAPKFFDVVTYTGTGGAANIAHNLGTTVGSLIIKRTDISQNWYVYHRGVNFGATQWPLLVLNTTAAASANKELINSTEPTDAVFSVASDLNTSGGTYVAYLFAHNDGDGGFNGGDIIKCGSYTGNGQNALVGGNPVELGFEPQWVMIIPATLAGYGSTIFDSMRGMANGNSIIDPFLQANTSGSEASYGAYIGATPTGFIVENSGGYNNENGQTYIYIAIRRGTKVPESGTEVFAVGDHGTTNPAWVSGFPVDMGWEIGGGEPYVSDRLRGTYLLPLFSTGSETNNTSYVLDYMNGMYSGTSYSPAKAHMWKRAPNFFDAVAYTGDGTAGRTVSHNLGVAPEMIWVKSRGNTGQWLVYNNNLNGGTSPEDYVLLVNSTSAQIGPNAVYWNSTAPSSTDFTVGTNSNVNTSGNTYIAYLFASLDGVSKVGSYTGNGTSQTIDCGFSSGARFVLTKRTNSTGNWNVWDSSRGIVAGNDPRIELNDQYGTIDSGHDYIDPDSSGFIVNYVADDDDDSNVNGDEYIFYAIA